jgi:hypothetical protein
MRAQPTLYRGRSSSGTEPIPAKLHSRTWARCLVLVTLRVDSDIGFRVPKPEMRNFIRDRTLEVLEFPSAIEHDKPGGGGEGTVQSFVAADGRIPFAARSRT